MVNGRTNQEWRCPVCGTLLGRDDNHLLRIRYKEVPYDIHPGAIVEAICRRCNLRVRRE